MPIQAPNTTTGAEWRARYCSEFYDVQGRHWRVEFIDSEINTGHNEFKLSTPSFAVNSPISSRVKY